MHVDVNSFIVLKNLGRNVKSRKNV